MSIRTGKQLLSPVAAATTLMVLLCPPLAKAETQSPFGLSQASRLKALPAAAADLTFRGEVARRTYSVFLSDRERKDTKVFQITLRNTVALLPERSSLTLVINGQHLAPIQLRSPNVFALTTISIPEGLLRAGRNLVELDVAMTHRVDCSVAATYELWAAVDPARTGFVVPDPPEASPLAFEEAVDAAAASGGTTSIHVRLADTADARVISRAARVVAALVRRGRVARASVDVGPNEGSGPGLDVAFGEMGNSLPGPDAVEDGPGNGIAFVRTASGRLTLVVSGSDEADLDATIDTFAARAPVAARRGEPVQIEGATQLSFADFGVPTAEFTGRRYTEALSLTLPGDFYPADYAKARLLIDGAHAANLDGQSELAFRVNGALAASFDLHSGRATAMHDVPADLPLSLFRPGRNEISLEAITPVAADKACDLTSAPPEPRLLVSNTSRVEFPSFAHLTAIPQIASAWSSTSGSASGAQIYIPKADPASVGAGLTVLANLAATGAGLAQPVVHIGMPGAGALPGLVIAPLADLPLQLSASVNARLDHLAGQARSEAKVVDAAATLTADGSTPASPVRVEHWPATVFERFPSAGRALDLIRNQTLVDLAAVRTGVGELLGRNTPADDQTWAERAKTLLRARGSGPVAADPSATFPFSARTLLISAIAPDTHRNLFGVALPRVAENADQWLVVTAHDSAVLETGIARMTADRLWPDLHGDLASLDVETGRLSTARPIEQSYVLPDHVALSEIRPILGGLLTDNLDLSLALIAALMTLLGVTTHALVRRAGAK